ncbi:MAG TPA: hypothetical protein VFJ74_05700 [Gemmatimonadaceae bacterium]|nr:hypothetical protein [Gemmatimonadaceae bacterium]
MNSIRPAVRTLAALAVLLPLAAAAVPLHAQMLGTPVLQNAFANKGVTVAADYGSGGGARSYGAAAAWAPASGRVILSLGGGVLDPSDAGVKSRTTYGVRAAFAVKELMDGAAGIGVFAGVGGGGAPKNDSLGVGSLLTVPAGITVGYRHALGATRAISVYASPFYSWAKATVAGQSASAGRIRVSGGLDVALVPKVGLTLGFESGAKAAAGKPGPTSSLFGVGLSYAFR